MKARGKARAFPFQHHVGRTLRGCQREGISMKVSEITSVGVQTVRPGTPAATARERMRAKKIHHLLAIVTLADLLDHVGGKRRHRRDAQTPPDLHYRVPHKTQHRASGSW